MKQSLEELLKDLELYIEENWTGEEPVSHCRDTLKKKSKKYTAPFFGETDEILCTEAYVEADEEADVKADEEADVVVDAEADEEVDEEADVKADEETDVDVDADVDVDVEVDAKADKEAYVKTDEEADSEANKKANVEGDEEAIEDVLFKGGSDMGSDSSSVSLESLLREVGNTFHERLFELIHESGMTDVEVYKRANIDRKLFSKIRNNPAYHPRKGTVLALAIALKLDIQEAEDLLARAEYALSPGSKSDVIIRYFIERRLYDIYVINIALHEHGLPVLE